MGVIENRINIQKLKRETVEQTPEQSPDIDDNPDDVDVPVES